MLKLKTCEVTDGGGFIAQYLATNKIEGGAASSAAIAVSLTSNVNGAKATVNIQEHPEASTEEEAFEALALLLESAAAAIRNRGDAKLGIPVYG